MEAVDNGELVVPVVSRRAKKEENRAFAPVKWMLGYGLPGPVELGDEALSFIPARWGGDVTKPPAGLVVLGPYEPSGAPFVVCAASQVFNALAKAAAGKETSGLERLQICLPPEDLDVGTDPHVYRAVLDAVLAHATSLALRKVVLVPPFQYGAKAAHYEALRKEVRGAVVAYGAVCLDPAPYLEENLWRVNPAVEGVYGLRPNPAGLKKIEQGLLNLVR
ncbi:MAG: hypothetical protein NTW87_21055 [Planctomycetota bacterium]|nr:hypothetical protein [Planctomycetota bacterium]